MRVLLLSRDCVFWFGTLLGTIPKQARFGMQEPMKLIIIKS